MRARATSDGGSITFWYPRSCARRSRRPGSTPRSWAAITARSALHSTALFHERMPSMSAEAIERLEMKVAYLERANNELSDVVYRQHREIEALRARLDALAERLSALYSQE